MRLVGRRVWFGTQRRCGTDSIRRKDRCVSSWRTWVRRVSTTSRSALSSPLADRWRSRAGSSMRPRQVRTELAGLRALLARRIDDAAAEALRREGCPAGDQLDELSRLERLVRLREAALADSRWRWAVPAVALVTLLALTILLFTRVSSTDVEIDLTVSEIGFHIPSVEALSNQMSVTTLGVS